jgi:hypothetical protein
MELGAWRGVHGVSDVGLMDNEEFEAIVTF